MKQERPLWELVQVIREQRAMDGIQPKTNLMEEVAKVQVADVALMKPEERAQWRQRIASRL